MERSPDCAVLAFKGGEGSGRATWATEIASQQRCRWQ